MKLCIKCLIELSADSFHKDGRRSDGLFPYCKDCRRKLINSKPMNRNIIGYYKGIPVCLTNDKRYPYIKKMRAHRYIMEDMLGRKLRDKEVVHHRDHDKHNWNPDNLELLTKEEHLSLHSTLRARRLGRTFSCSTCTAEVYYSPSKINKISKTNYTCGNCRKIKALATYKEKYDQTNDQ